MDFSRRSVFVDFLSIFVNVRLIFLRFSWEFDIRRFFVDFRRQAISLIFRSFFVDVRFSVDFSFVSVDVRFSFILRRFSSIFGVR